MPKAPLKSNETLVTSRNTWGLGFGSQALSIGSIESRGYCGVVGCG